MSYSIVAGPAFLGINFLWYFPKRRDVIIVLDGDGGRSEIIGQVRAVWQKRVAVLEVAHWPFVFCPTPKNLPVIFLGGDGICSADEVHFAAGVCGAGLEHG